MIDTSEFRILAANEPRLTREAITGALRLLRPHVATIDVEPADLDAEVVHHRPHLVLCSQLTETVQGSLRSWILLNPDGTNLAVISVDGWPRILHGVELIDLLVAVDEAIAGATDDQGGTPYRSPPGSVTHSAGQEVTTGCAGKPDGESHPLPGSSPTRSHEFPPIADSMGSRS